MFADVEADIYLMADGDCTYDVSVAPNLVEKLLVENLDMVVGCRIDRGESENYRRGRRFGNQMLTGSVRHIFGGQFTYFWGTVYRYAVRLQSVFAAICQIVSGVGTRF